MTDQSVQFPRFYVTAPAECPYIEGLEERKVFTELKGDDASALNEALGRVGFRRSQTIVYRPACEGCAACISVRIPVTIFSPNRSMRKINNRNKDLVSAVMPPKATKEQYELLASYLDQRHPGGSMSDMSMSDYAEMVEESPVTTLLIEYRHRLNGSLMAVALTDQLSDGYSMIYSFFNITEDRRSLGTYIILDHIERALCENRHYVYLGYWVKNSSKMDYKNRFRPLERLGSEGWSVVAD